MLGQNTGMYQGDEAWESFLPDALANGMLRAARIDGGTHRFQCLGQVPLTADEPQSPGGTNRLITVYEADLAPVGARWVPSATARPEETTQGRRSKSGGR